MLTIRKIGGLVILAALLMSHAFAETGTGNYVFSLYPNIGFLYGQAKEIVYKDPPYQYLSLSELYWDLKPLVYAGLDADFTPVNHSGKRGFISALSFKAGLPIKTGIIEDLDWINADYITHYSRHNAYSKTAFLLDISAGYFWRFSDSLALSAYGEFSYMHFSWSATDGYSQHSVYFPWNSDLPKSYYTGEVLRYKQDWLIVTPGVSLGWDINNLFSMKAHFNYSPLIYCADRDDHLLTKTTYLDYLYFGHYFKSGGEFAFSVSEKTGLSLSLSHKYITGTRGYTIYKSSRFDDGAGAGYLAIDLGLAVEFRLTGRD